MVQMFEAHAGIGGAELPMDALLDRVAGLRPRGALRVDAACVGMREGQGLARQDAQFRFGPVEPAAVPGRKHSLYAPSQTACLGGRKRPVKRGVGMGVQIVADPDQALGLAVAWRWRFATGPAVPRTSEGAGDAPHVFVVVGGGVPRTRRLRRPLVGLQRFGLLVHADHRIARIVGLAIEIQHPFPRDHEVRLRHRRIAPLYPTPRRQFVF